MKLVTFGRLRLEGSELTRQKPLLLLAYLTVEGTKPRRHLAELFFSETRDPLNGLSRALSYLRKLAPSLMGADHTRVWATDEVINQNDAAAFMLYADAEEYEVCERLYGGPFAADLNIPLSAELEEWVLGTREYLAGRQRDLLLNLAEQRAAQGKLTKAASYAERAYTLSGASELEPEHFGQVYKLLTLGNSPRAAAVREEAKTFGIELNTEVNDLRAKARVVKSDSIGSNLPLPKSSFVGRSTELLEIAKQFACTECRLLTLHGTGGVGKSRLAMQAAYQAAELGTFRDGLTFVSLDSLTSADLIPINLAEALRLSPQGHEDTLTQVMQYLIDKRALVIFDNYEHLMEGATLLARLLENCPHLKILVTSRERLNLDEEWVLAVQGFSVPRKGDIRLEQAQHYDAFNLFIQRAKRSRLDFALIEKDLPYALEICELVEGLPLGIELAASWVKQLPVANIADEVKKNVDILVSSSRNSSERHQSIRAVFEHSWKLLTPTEKVVLMRLSIFVGGFRREAAAEVAGATIPVLTSLIDKSLLRVGISGRYSHYPVLHKYLKEKLHENDVELQHTERKYCQFFVNLLGIEAASENRDQSLRVGSTISEELTNLQKAWQLAATKYSDLELESFSELIYFYDRKARFEEGINALSKIVVDLNSYLNKNLLLIGLYTLDIGWLYYRSGKLTKARSHIRKGLHIVASQEATKALALGLSYLGAVELASGHHEYATEYYQRALSISKRRNDKYMIAALYNNIAEVERLEGRYSSAATNYKKAVQLHIQQKNLFGLVIGLCNMGELTAAEGNNKLARSYFVAALRMAYRLQFDMPIPILYANLLEITITAANKERLEKISKYAINIAKNLNDESAESALLIVQGRIASQQCKWHMAYSLLRSGILMAYSNQAYPIALKGLYFLGQISRMINGKEGKADEIFAFLATYRGTTAKYRIEAKEAANEMSVHPGLQSKGIYTKLNLQEGIREIISRQFSLPL